MKTVLRKWGNSFAIRIPKVLIDKFQLTEGASLSIDTDENQIALVPLSNDERLKKALEDVSFQQVQFVEDGGLLGKEVWEYEQ